MDRQRLIDRARTAGLDRALAECPEDVLAAALEAENLHDALAAVLSPADEPWPPMRVPER